MALFCYFDVIFIILALCYFLNDGIRALYIQIGQKIQSPPPVARPSASQRARFPRTRGGENKTQFLFIHISTKSSVIFMKLSGNLTVGISR